MKTATKRLAVTLGLIAGFGAVIWALRDRFVSLSPPHEGAPAPFRVSPEERPPPAVEQADDLTAITGIGPVYASRLEKAGIASFAALAAADAATAAKAAGASAGRVAGWIEQAKFLAAFEGDTPG